MSDHNIIQIETNVKIGEKQQSHQFKEDLKLGFKDLNFFNEDNNHANIDAELFNTDWVMLFSDVNIDKMYKIITDICLDTCKKHVPPKKRPRKHQMPRDS